MPYSAKEKLKALKNSSCECIIMAAWAASGQLAMGGIGPWGFALLRPASPSLRSPFVLWVCYGLGCGADYGALDLDSD